MLKFFEWFTLNWKIITLILGFIFVFAMIKPVADLLRGVKDGIKELFTPTGFLAFLILLALAIFLFVFFKGVI